ncbi:MAG: IS1 family transposase [Cyanobacteria bacterium P01_A01_bin.17]
MNCPHCNGRHLRKAGFGVRQSQKVQRYWCVDCNRRFSDHANTPMFSVRKPIEQVERVLAMRSEGMGIRAVSRVEHISPQTVINWEKRLAAKVDAWSPPVPEEADITAEGDEVYTRVNKNHPAHKSQGWTLNIMERQSRDWWVGLVGLRDNALFEAGMQRFWNWAQSALFIRLFTDGERRYSQSLWPVASIFLKKEETSRDYHHRKVWRYVLEVACKIKGSQGNPRRAWCYREHPLTAISDESEVHANHQEAFNASLRRRCSGYRRRQNLYAKQREGLQRSVDVQRLIHNWVRVHISLPDKSTPAMSMGYIERPVTLREILTCRGFEALSS